MSRRCCNAGCDNPRTVYFEYDHQGCSSHCESVSIPVGSILDWPIDYSAVLGSDCDEAVDIHIIDQANSTAIVTQAAGPVGAVNVDRIEFTDSVMTVWIDATAALPGGYHSLSLTMTSDKGRTFTHSVSLNSQAVTC